jgi:hypothetical protein
MIYSKHSIRNGGGKLFCKGRIQFGGKGCSSDGEEELSINLFV